MPQPRLLPPVLNRPSRVVALTPRGAPLARRLAATLPGAACWLPAGVGDAEGCQTFGRFAEVAAQAFAAGENLVCIMAAGIVVRTIAPLLTGKDQDPAVVVLDENGQFAVSLLSGHLGGANQLARTVAALLGSQPVITTATDVAGLPALDALGPELGLEVENLTAVRAVSRALLAGQKVALVDPEGRLAEVVAAHPGCFAPENDLEAALARSGPGIYVGCREQSWPPEWLRLRPKVLVVGLGCHRGTGSQEILAFLAHLFQRERLSLACLKALVTVAARKDEPGLQEAARRLGVELLWFTPAELAKMDAPNPSPHPAKALGTPSVAEAAALKAAGGRLIVPKQKTANLTLAVARAS